MLLWIALACVPDMFTDVEAHVAAEVNTVIEIGFSLREAADVHAAYMLDGSLQQTPTLALVEGDHTLRILGVPPVTNVQWELVARYDGQQRVSERTIFRTGNLPAAVPVFHAETLDEGAIDPVWFAAAVLNAGGENVRLILDRLGRVVWYDVVDVGLTSPWIQTVPGVGLLANQFDAQHCEDLGEVQTLDLSGHVIDAQRTLGGHHAFAAHEDGTLAWIAIDKRDVAEFDEPVCGDRILELAPGETEPVEIYSTWDTLSPDPDQTVFTEFYCDCIDWTHANMLSWEPQLDSYLLSLGSLDGVLEVHRDSGRVTRSFGHVDDAYDFAAQTAHFNHQHGVNYTDDDTLLLTWSDPLNKRTRATEYVPEDQAQVLEAIWSYGPDPPLKASALGEAHRLDNGNTLVNFGSAGALHEVDAQGELLWKIETDVGLYLGRIGLIEDLYTLE